MSEQLLSEPEASELFAKAILSALNKPEPKFRDEEEDEEDRATSINPFASRPLSWSTEHLS